METSGGHAVRAGPAAGSAGARQDRGRQTRQDRDRPHAPTRGAQCRKRAYETKGALVIAQILEAAMLICFGLSWPLNAYKSYQAKTAVGTSWQFILLITAGYFAGIAAKLCAGSFTWVLAVYFLNVAFLGANWAVYFRNRRLDKAALASAAL